MEDNTAFTDTDFDEIVKTWYGLGVLVNKKSLDEMTNQEKLRMIIYLFQKENNYVDTFSQEELEKTHQNSVIKDLDITYEDLFDYYGTFSWNTSSVAYNYNESEKTFISTGALGHGAVALGDIAHSEIISISKPGDEYIVKYRYIFFDSHGDGPTDEDLYLSAEDAINKTNEWVQLKLDEDNQTHRNEYIEEHYDEVKDGLPIYTYTFKVEDGHLVITDFSVEAAS